MNKPKLVTVTPEIAREYLKANRHNLPIRQTHVDYLADEMSSGRWQLTHQGIAFDGDVLVDGQHRLLAVINSGATVPMWVFGDVPMSAQVLVDKGRIRSLADELHHFDGIPNAQQRVSACRSVVSMCCYFQGVKVSGGLCKTVLDDLGESMSVVIDYTREFKPAFRAWVIGALSFALSGESALSDFIAAAGTGENLKHGDPAKALRDWLTNGSPSARSHYKRYAIEGVMNAAYNHLQGTRLLTVKRGSQGLDYFMSKKRKLVSALRHACSQQIQNDQAA